MCLGSVRRGRSLPESTLTWDYWQWPLSYAQEMSSCERLRITLLGLGEVPTIGLNRAGDSAGAERLVGTNEGRAIMARPEYS